LLVGIFDPQEKNALIDTVRVDFEDELLDKIKQKIDLEKLHYVIMNHAEPDHAGLIPRIMEANNNVILITSAKGAIVAADYYNVPKERIKIVKDGDKIQLGGKTLEFIDAPMLHWPETMFTYLIEDKILFPCDFFGSHTAFGIYDEDSEDLITNAKKCPVVFNVLENAKLEFEKGKIKLQAMVVKQAVVLANRALSDVLSKEDQNKITEVQIAKLIKGK